MKNYLTCNDLEGKTESEQIEITLNAIDQKIEFDEMLIYNLRAGEYFSVTEEESSTEYMSRWDIGMSAIIHIGDRNFRIYWSEGLTEEQDDEYWSQVPEEVKLIKRTVIIEDWVPIDHEG